MKLKQSIVSILFISVVNLLNLENVFSDQGSGQISKESQIIKTKLVESAERLLNLENDLIEEINKVRSGRLVEAHPMEMNMFFDVIYLLEYALYFDENDIKTTFLLGKIYYLQRDLADEPNKDAILNSKKYLNKVKELCKKNNNECTILEETNKMLKVINWKAKFFDKSKE